MAHTNRKYRVDKVGEAEMCDGEYGERLLILRRVPLFSLFSSLRGLGACRHPVTWDHFCPHSRARVRTICMRISLWGVLTCETIMWLSDFRVYKKIIRRQARDFKGPARISLTMSSFRVRLKRLLFKNSTHFSHAILRPMVYARQSWTPISFSFHVS